MQIVVKEVETRRDLKRFYQFQNKLYKNSKEYVPTLDIDQKKSLTSVSTLSYCLHKMWMVEDSEPPFCWLQLQ